MKKIELKGQVFGASRPILCVPVVERSADEIINTVKKITGHGIPMIEWRIDWFDRGEDIGAVLEVLKELNPYLKQTVFLCTFRSQSQGGEKSMDRESYLRLNDAVAKSGVADLIDLEFFEFQEADIEGIRQNGVKVVCSDHNFQTTPSVEEMKQQLIKMTESGADFAKLAVMPREKADVLHLMEAVLSVKETYPDSHIIAMSMGGDGVISRLLGSWYGSEVTFASFGKASAPGQVDYGLAEGFLDKFSGILP